MKNIYTFLIILLLGITLTAQAQFINYQGVARDNAGNILINQPIALRLSVLIGSAVGSAVFVETHATTTDAYGLFTLQIGQGAVVSGVFNDIAWSSTSFFLKVEIDPTGGTNYGLAGTTQFAAVPYSLHAKTADNGFSGNYNDLTNQPVLFDGAFGSLTGKPSTLAGYGIIDGMNTSHVANAITNGNITNWNTAFAWGNHAGLYRPITYIPTWGEVTGKPVFATVATSGSYNDLANLPSLFNGTWLSLTGKPTTLAGYGITDAMNTSHAANAITNTNITNWNTAFTWGNHAGLYRPIGYVPAWSEITANPFAFSAVANNQLLKYNTTSGKWENWTPNYLTSFTETDPSWTAASPNYYTKSNLQTNGAAAMHFNNLTNKPTTLLGYGITDAMNTSHAANTITNTNITNWNTAFAWGNHAGLYRPIGYVPAWGEITANPFAFTAVANNQLLKYNSGTSKWENWTPNYLTSFTETDPSWTAASPNYYTKTNLQTSGAAAMHFNNLTNKPTTLLGYGITDAMNTGHAANGITNTNINNWNTAFAWGNHAGLYRPIGYVPAWGEITANPFAFTAVANNQLLKYNSGTSKWENWTPNYLTSFTETDPIFGAWDKSSGIVIASSQVSDFAASVTNTPAVLANTAKNSYPTEDAAKLAGIAAGAEVNVNADWNATSGDAQILNKPTGTNPGDMLYWNGTQWLKLPIGTEGQVLKITSGIPTWGSSVQFASIITTAISGIGATTAISGGNVSDGGAPVTARGVCWGTTASPTIEGSKTTDGIGSGAFTSNITGLLMATTYHVRAYATNTKGTAYGDELSFITPVWLCGTSAITVNHSASGGVAPVDKSVSYAIVTNIPGETDKCWITKNLGATNQATSVSDASEEAAGWYWQFNKPQGYKHDGSTRTPNSTWISSINENSDWLPANDPCTLELGSGWRLPTSTEWTNVDATGGWTIWNGPYNSGLKLHAAGDLEVAGNGFLNDRGTYGFYWTSKQIDADWGFYMSFGSASSVVSDYIKTYGFTVRCLTGTGTSMTTPTVTTASVTGITTTTASSGGNVESDGGTSVSARGVCWSTTPNPTITDTKTTDGSGTGTFSSSITGLTASTTYHVRAYATNSSGTAYGNDVSIVTSAPPFTCGSSITINHVAGDVAPVNKTTTYGTVTNIPGEPTKCWITQNLGADHQATSVDDATEASAGWYWQFNKKQGYKHDGTTRTPNSTWISSIDENSDWLLANDPCTLELGSGWRLPTNTEWTNVDVSGGWTTWTDPYNSGLKLHAAGFLSSSSGSLSARGSDGYYWGSTQLNANYGWNLLFANGGSYMYYHVKANGFTARCIKD